MISCWHFDAHKSLCLTKALHKQALLASEEDYCSGEDDEKSYASEEDCYREDDESIIKSDALSIEDRPAGFGS
jgi:hypothetical protein